MTSAVRAKLITKFLSKHQDLLVSNEGSSSPLPRLEASSSADLYDRWLSYSKQLTAVKSGIKRTANAIRNKAEQAQKFSDEFDINLNSKQKKLSLPKLKKLLEDKRITNPLENPFAQTDVAVEANPLKQPIQFGKVKRIDRKDNQKKGFSNAELTVAGIMNKAVITANNNIPILSMNDFVAQARDIIFALLRRQLKDLKTIKAQMYISIDMEKPLEELMIRDTINFFGPTAQVIRDGEDETLLEFILNSLAMMNIRLEEFNQKGSGWTIVNVVSIQLDTYRFTPLIGGSFKAVAIPAPYAKVVINPKSDDNKCLIYAIVIGLNKYQTLPGGRVVVRTNRERLSPYKKELEALDLSGIDFPTPINNKMMIRRVEQMMNVHLNIFNAGVSEVVKVKTTTVDKDGKETTVITNKNGDTNIDVSERKKVNPTHLYASSYEQWLKFEDTPERRLNILFIQHPETEKPVSNIAPSLDTMYENAITDRTGHYVLITDFDAMMFQLTKKNDATAICPHCLSHFNGNPIKNDPNPLMSAKERASFKRNAHVKDGLCMLQDAVKVELPAKGMNILQFKKFNNQEKCPFVVYADFESILPTIIPTEEAEDDACGEVSKPKSTTHTHDHQNMSFGLTMVSTDARYNEAFYMERRVEVDSDKFWDKRFWDYILALEGRVQKILETIVPMNLTPAEEKSFQLETKCHICKCHIDPGECENKNKNKVRDHNHMTGAYRGPAHNICNLNYNHKNFCVPIVFHNLKGYDSHFIIKTLTTQAGARRMDVIAQNSEKFMSITNGNIKFIDSFAFLSTSLEKLVSGLGSDIKNFPILQRNFLTATPEQLQLLLQKGTYPYEYIKSLATLNETQLPPIEAFFSSLRGANITKKEYQHAQHVWSAFNIKSLAEYHDLYLKTDVLLLADVFENFRSIELSATGDGLDPIWYLSLPAYSWDCALKKSKVKLELFHDKQVDMYLFCEAGIRGGMCIIANRYAKANNKYMDDYDASKPSIYLFDVDANNLYAYGMMAYLPYGGFHWDLNPERFTAQHFLNMSDNQEDGCFIMCDLKYPQELHDLHNDLPLCPSQEQPQWSHLSLHQQSIYERHYPRTTVKETYPSGLTARSYTIEDNETYYKSSRKLLGTLNDKKNYIIHYQALKQCLQLGLELTKVHKVLHFKQKPWLKSYIESNTDKRKVAKTDFEKDYYKLKNNAVFGKTMEDTRKHGNYRIAMDRDVCRKLLAKPNFKRANIIRPDYPNTTEGAILGIELHKTDVKLNKPIYTGLSILDLSKTVMYNYHYNVIKKEYGDKAVLQMTDTDSLIYEIETDDIYQDMSKSLEHYDTSEYPEGLHFSGLQLQSNQNKKVVAKMKDEMKGEVLLEFVGLRPKAYSKRMREKEVCKAKGTSQSAVKNNLTFQSYKDCLFTGATTRLKNYALRSFNHEVRSIVQEKAGLSAFDDKRFLRDDGIRSYAYGHYRINEELVAPQGSSPQGSSL